MDMDDDECASAVRTFYSRGMVEKGQMDHGDHQSAHPPDKVSNLGQTGRASECFNRQS